MTDGARKVQKALIQQLGMDKFLAADAADVAVAVLASRAPAETVGEPTTVNREEVGRIKRQVYTVLAAMLANPKSLCRSWIPEIANAAECQLPVPASPEPSPGPAPVPAAEARQAEGARFTVEQVQLAIRTFLARLLCDSDHEFAEPVRREALRLRAIAATLGKNHPVRDAAPSPAPRKGPKCINCGVDYDGGYCTEDIGPFCSLCWEALQQVAAPSPAPPASSGAPAETPLHLAVLAALGATGDEIPYEGDDTAHLVKVCRLKLQEARETPGEPPRFTRCSRCAASWLGAPMVCAECGAEATHG